VFGELAKIYCCWIIFQPKHEQDGWDKSQQGPPGCEQYGRGDAGCSDQEAKSEQQSRAEDDVDMHGALAE
jgi:hypothetical protein